MGINMIQSLSITSVFCFAALALASSVHGNPLMNIVELASNDPNLSTFVTALKASEASKDINLIATLSSPLFAFTVFAPTNKAFALIPEATLAHLLDPANVNELVDILKYHVLSTPIEAKELKNMTTAESLEGKSLILQNLVDPDPKDRPFNVLLVNNAEAKFVDIKASNGVVHIIDQVLLPTYVSDLNIMEIVSSKPELSTFATALKAGLLNGALEGNGRLQVTKEFKVWDKFVNNCAYGQRGPSIFKVPSNGAQCPFTVVAPSNDAFAKLPQATLDHLLDPKNVGELQAILEFHIIPGVVLTANPSEADDHIFRGFYSTLGAQGTNFNAAIINDTTILSPDRTILYEPIVKQQISTITQANLGASNGVVHVIDSVLIPNAPTNDAFAKLPKGTLEHLLDPRNIGEQQNILEYHIIPGVAMRTGCKQSGRTCGQGDVEANGFIKTLAGQDVTISTTGEVGVFGQVMIDKATTVSFENSYCDGTGQADVMASNGIWTQIDQVLLPSLVTTL